MRIKVICNDRSPELAKELLRAYKEKEEYVRININGIIYDLLVFGYSQSSHLETTFDLQGRD